MTITAAERRQQAERAAATKQFFDMFQTLLVTLQEKYVPRAEYSLEKQQQDRMMTELTGSVREVSATVSALVEALPERFPTRREFDSGIAASVRDREELRKLIGEAVRDREEGERRSWDYKLNEQGKRYEGDERSQQGTQQALRGLDARTISMIQTLAFVLLSALLGFLLARGGP